MSLLLSPVSAGSSWIVKVGVFVGFFTDSVERNIWLYYYELCNNWDWKFMCNTNVMPSNMICHSFYFYLTFVGQNETCFVEPSPNTKLAPKSRESPAQPASTALLVANDELIRNFGFWQHCRCHRHFVVLWDGPSPWVGSYGCWRYPQAVGKLCAFFDYSLWRQVHSRDHQGSYNQQQGIWCERNVLTFTHLVSILLSNNPQSSSLAEVVTTRAATHSVSSSPFKARRHCSRRIYCIHL